MQNLPMRYEAADAKRRILDFILVHLRERDGDASDGGVRNFKSVLSSGLLPWGKK